MMLETKTTTGCIQIVPSLNDRYAYELRVHIYLQKEHSYFQRGRPTDIDIYWILRLLN